MGDKFQLWTGQALVRKRGSIRWGHWSILLEGDHQFPTGKNPTVLHVMQQKAFLHLLPDLQETAKNICDMGTPIPKPYRPSLNTWRPWTDLCLWNTIPISCFSTDKRQTVSPLAPPSFVRPLEEKSIYLWSRCLTFNLKI